MKQISIKKYTHHGEWDHYFTSPPSNPIGDVPEIITQKISKILPKYIKNVYNFGCSNGRDFIPFQDDYNCIGFDIAPLDYIKWVCKTDNLTYYQCKYQDFTSDDLFKSIDLSNSLICTTGTLMIGNPLEQNNFIEFLIQKGCKNMVFQEYGPASRVPHQKLHLNEDLLPLFTQKIYRQEVVSFINLDIDNETLSTLDDLPYEGDVNLV